ncbi:UNVERIFIED_CONTAM: hypothetical protein GTU68_064627 [Idotea baltica]|nr:hypothetical protein [Idotea baltica]
MHCSRAKLLAGRQTSYLSSPMTSACRTLVSWEASILKRPIWMPWPLKVWF